MNSMISNQHKQIIKSWSGLSEIDVIKMVIGDGKHIDLCMNYWSRKRRISVKQYEVFFQDVVLSHINHLLTQCLFNEAEKILNNVKYDIRYAFYQFAVECNNGKIRDMVFKYLQERNPDDYTELINNLQVNWSIVQCLKKNEKNVEDLKKYMYRTDFISFMNLEDNIKELILIKLFFKTRRSAVLQQIRKCAFWEFLIKNQNINEIIRWCHQQGIHSNHNVLPNSLKDDLLIQYKTWKITNEMYEYALKNFENIENDVLRNVFAANGYFFNESNHLHLYRICLTESFVYNHVYINNLNLNLVNWIIQNQWYYLLLCDVTNKEEYDRLAVKQIDNNAIINLISILRNVNINQFAGFQQISINTRKCLQQMNFNPKHILFKYWETLTMQTPVTDIINDSTTSLSINLNRIKLPFEECRNKLEKFKNINHFNEFHSYDLLKAVNNQINLKELRRIGENFARSYLNDVMPISTKCMHYVKQLRSAFAVYSWFTGHLSQYRQIPNIRYYATCQNLYNLALKLPPDAEEFCHCIAFCEMLGFDTQPFRCFLHLLHYLDKNRIQIFENINSISYSKIQSLLANQMISSLKHHSKSFPLIKFKALLSINNEIYTFATFKDREADESTICGGAGYPINLKAVLQIICYYTKNNDYWSFLILLQYCSSFTLKHLQALIKSFPNAAIRNNLIHAILFKFLNNLLNINHQNYHHHKFQTKNSIKSNKQISKGSNRHQTTFILKCYLCNQYNETAFRCDGFMYSSFMCKQRMLANVVSSANCCHMRNIPDLLAHILSLNYIHQISNAKQEANISSKQFVDMMQISLKDEDKCIYCKYRHIQHTILEALYCAIHDRSSILAILATVMHVPDSNNDNVSNFCSNANLAWCWLTWLTVITSNCWHPTTLNIANRPHFFWQLIEIIIQAKQLNHLIRSFIIFYPTYALLNLFRFLQLTLEINENKVTTAIDTLKLYYMDLNNGGVQTPFGPCQYNSIECSAPNEKRYLIGHSIRVLLQHLQTNFPLPIQRQNYLDCICLTGFADHKNIFDFNLLRDFHRTIVNATNIIGDVEHANLDFNQLIDSSDPYQYYLNVINDILANKYYNLAVNLLLLLDKPIGDVICSKWMYIFSEILSVPKVSTSTASSVTLASKLPILPRATKFPTTSSMEASCKTMTITNNRSTDLCSAIKNCDQRYQELIQMFDKCEQEILHYSLSSEMLVNFLIYIANKLPTDDHRIRYLIFYKALNIIKQHHLLSYDLIDHDQIEFDMIMCYVKIDVDNVPNNRMPLYHSKYFEEVMASEHGILYKSLMELKEMVTTHNYHNVDRNNKAPDVNSYQSKELNDQESKRIEVLLNQLLDAGDIVQALRLQELFHITTMDMRCIICSMGLAEKFIDIPSNSLYNEKLFHNDIDKYTHLLINQYPPLYTLDTFDANAYIDVLGGVITASDGDVHAGVNFATLPADHRQDILRVLQHIQNNKVKHGLQLMNRIVCAYRTAMFLNKDYVDILHTKDIQILLKTINNESSSQHLLIMRDILTSSHMNCEELTKIIAYEIVAIIIRSQFHNFNHSHFSESSERSNPKMVKRNVHLWGYNIDLNMQLFLQIVPDSTKLGIYILKYCDALKIYRRYQNNQKCDISNQFFKDIIIILGGSITKGNAHIQTRCQNANQTAIHQVLSHKKQMFTYVELLIKAHHCFVYECSMEGIANVLHRTKNLNTILTQTKSWSLIIRMLIGIGRYQDMSYCFQSLIENEQFESLLGQFEEDKTICLRQAILAFLRSRCHQPQQSKELFQLAALHFLMYKDLAEMWQHDAEQILQQIYETASAPMVDSYNADKDSNSDLRTLQVNPTILTLLHQALDYCIHAAENYLLDNKIHLAGKNTSQAELIALQIDMANKVSESNDCSDEANHECTCILKLKLPNTIQHLVNNKLSVYQSTIICRVYNYNVSWSEALLYQFVIHLQDSYLNEFLQLVDLNDLMLENIVKSFQHYCMQHQVNKEMEEHLAKLITFVKSITLKYKLASILSLKPVVLSLINNNNSIYFLRDMNFNTKVNKAI